MKRENEGKIKERIKQREKMSELASNSYIQMDDRPKEKLIERNLQEKFFINDLGNKTDPLYERVKNKYQDNEYLQQNYLNKYISNEKPGVKEFYLKYVEYIKNLYLAITLQKREKMKQINSRIIRMIFNPKLKRKYLMRKRKS